MRTHLSTATIFKVHDEGSFWAQADEVLIAQPDPDDLERDTYQEWLDEHDISRTDPRLRGLRVQLRTTEYSPKPLKHYLLPDGIVKSLVDGDPAPQTMVGLDAHREAIGDAVTHWTLTAFDDLAAQYRAAAEGGDRLEQVKVWQRVDTLRQLMRNMTSDEDLGRFEGALEEHGVPAEEPDLHPSNLGDSGPASEIDLRQATGIGSQLRTSGKSLLAFGRRRGGS